VQPQLEHQNTVTELVSGDPGGLTAIPVTIGGTSGSVLDWA
jgi:hypothetical protein